MMKACAWDKERVNGVESSRMWSRAVQPHVFLVTTSSHLSRFCIPTFILLTVIYCIGHCSYPQPAFSSWCFSLSEILGMVQFGIVWGSSATCDSAIPAALFACQRTSPGRIRQYQSDKCFDAQSYTVCSTTVTGVATSTTLRKQSIPDCGPPDGAFGVPLYAQTAAPNLHSNIHCVGSVWKQCLYHFDFLCFNGATLWSSSPPANRRCRPLPSHGPLCTRRIPCYGGAPTARRWCPLAAIGVGQHFPVYKLLHMLDLL
jgi:hypothetical protein